jgi:hypothetical protein
VILAALGWYLFSTAKKKEENFIASKPAKKNDSNADKSDDENIFEDESGKYRIVAKTREFPRKTYLLGRLHGKYWGEIDPQKENEYFRSKFFDFHIYEAEVTGSEISQSEFNFIPDSRFPRERLPQLLPIIVKRDEREYSINIHEPQLGEV